METRFKEYYDSLLSSMQLSEVEQHNLNAVKANIEADKKISPFRSDRWYKDFMKDNQDTFNLAEAPVNEFLMVVSDSFGTLIKNGRGTALNRGALIVKLEDTLINCVDGSYWYASPSGNAYTFSQSGYFDTGSSLYGNLKLLRDIKILQKSL